MKIILIGNAGSGKSTVANYLVKKYGFTEFALADKLKELTFKILRELQIKKIDSIEELYKVKSKNKFRRYLQIIGTECCRSVFGNDFWCEMLKKEIDKCENDNIVISDVRFCNEANYFKDDYVRWKIEGTKFNNVNYNHASEADINKIEFDIEINNEIREFDVLYKNIDKVMMDVYGMKGNDIVLDEVKCLKNEECDVKETQCLDELNNNDVVQKNVLLDEKNKDELSSIEDTTEVKIECIENDVKDDSKLKDDHIKNDVKDDLKLKDESDTNVNLIKNDVKYTSKPIIESIKNNIKDDSKMSIKLIKNNIKDDSKSVNNIKPIENNSKPTDNIKTNSKIRYNGDIALDEFGLKCLKDEEHDKETLNPSSNTLVEHECIDPKLTEIKSKLKTIERNANLMTFAGITNDTSHLFENIFSRKRNNPFTRNEIPKQDASNTKETINSDVISHKHNNSFTQDTTNISTLDNPITKETPQSLQSEITFKANTISSYEKGVIGEDSLCDLIRSVDSKLEVTKVSSTGHLADIHVIDYEYDIKYIVESKFKQSITREDLNKFIKDIELETKNQEMSSKLIVGLFLSINSDSIVSIGKYKFSFDYVYLTSKYINKQTLTIIFDAIRLYKTLIKDKPIETTSKVTYSIPNRVIELLIQLRSQYNTIQTERNTYFEIKSNADNILKNVQTLIHEINIREDIIKLINNEFKDIFPIIESSIQNSDEDRLREYLKKTKRHDVKKKDLLSKFPQMSTILGNMKLDDIYLKYTT